MTVNKRLLELIDYYETNGKCKEHYWTNCNPIKTSEGEFIIKTCFVCKFSKVKYKGEIITGELRKIVDFLIRRGLENEKNQNL